MTRIQTTSRLVLRALLTGMFLMLLALSAGCSKDPVERTIERFEQIADLMDAHKQQPDELLTALEAFADENAGAFGADRAEIEALDPEAQEELEAKHEKALHAVLLRVMDTNREIQDRLRDDPEKLARFLAILQRIN